MCNQIDVGTEFHTTFGGCDIDGGDDGVVLEKTGTMPLSPAFGNFPLLNFPEHLVVILRTVKFISATKQIPAVL